MRINYIELVYCLAFNMQTLRELIFFSKVPLLYRCFVWLITSIIHTPIFKQDLATILLIQKPLASWMSHLDIFTP